MLHADAIDRRPSGGQLSQTRKNCSAIGRSLLLLAAGVDPYDASAEAPHEVVSFTGSFHGRTLGALALTYKDAYKIPFAPGLPGARMVKYLDLDAAAAVIKKVRRLLLARAASTYHAAWLRATFSRICRAWGCQGPYRPSL